MHISGKTWRASVAAVLTSLVLVAGVSSAAPITRTDIRIVDADRCNSVSEYDRPVFIRGTFAVKRTWDGTDKPEKRGFNGCYMFDDEGNVLTPDGPRWIVGGSLPFLRGYSHGEDVQRGGDDWVRMGFVGDRQFDNYAYINSYGAIWRNGEWQHVGLWSDWYNAGYRAGYMAEKKRQDIQRETKVCQNRVRLIDIQPRTYGPELTFTVLQFLPEVHVTRVVIGFREVSPGSRQPMIVSGRFPWCITVSSSHTASGPMLEIDRGNHILRLSYDLNGPYFERNHPMIPEKFFRTHNEDLWTLVTG